MKAELSRAMELDGLEDDPVMKIRLEEMKKKVDLGDISGAQKNMQQVILFINFFNSISFSLILTSYSVLTTYISVYVIRSNVCFLFEVIASEDKDAVHRHFANLQELMKAGDFEGVRCELNIALERAEQLKDPKILRQLRKIQVNHNI